MSINADTTFVAPSLRTVSLRAALAVGAAAVAGGFGAGYVLAQTLDQPVRATLTEPRVAAGHTFGDALTEAFALKQRSVAGTKASDIRYRRIR